MKIFIAIALAALAAAEELQTIRGEFFKTIAASNPRIEPTLAYDLLKSSTWSRLQSDYETEKPIMIARNLLEREQIIAEGLGVAPFNFRDYFHAYPVPDWANTDLDERVQRELAQVTKDSFAGAVKLSLQDMKSYYKCILKDVQTDGLCPTAAIAK